MDESIRAKFRPYGHSASEKIQEIVAQMDLLAQQLTEIAQCRSDNSSFVRQLLKLRARRREFLGDLFGEPAWDILLDLYAADLDGQAISVSSSCIASGVPQTTGLRWLKVLIERGLVTRARHHADARQVLVRLSDDGRRKMNRIVAEWQQTLLR